MLKKMLVLCLVGVGLLLLSFEAGAALKPVGKSTATADPVTFYNPKAAADDMELPMPCGLKMVLRPVAIPVSGLLDDKRFSMGLRVLDEDRGFYEKQTSAHIGAPFRQENLPADWRSRLDTAEAGMYCYYFIGKYELSTAQWSAVMEGKLPEGRGDLPKTNISWYDVQEFLRRYNEWLLAEHPEAVPAIDSVPAFFRLPTEVEWEFAARGGNLPPERQDETDFLLEEGRSVEDYAVFGSRYESAMPIGSKMGNVLGIYDMAGNVAELVQGGFRFTISDSVAGGGHVRRLHGAEGGLVVKGGSFLSAGEKDVYPGKRVEIRMFEKQGDGTFLPHRTRTLGARLVLASVNVPGMNRAMSIRQEESRLGGGRAMTAQASEPAAPVQKPAAEASSPVSSGDRLVTVNLDGEPLEELEKIYAATSSPLVKSNLDQLRDLLTDVNASLVRERDANLLSALRSAAYKADSLANIAFRCFQLDYELKNLKEKIPNLPKKEENKFRNQIREHYRNLEISTNFYRLSVKEIAAFPPDDVAVKIMQLRKEYTGDDKLNVNFRKNIDTFAEHVAFAREQGTAKLTNSMIWDKVIPGKRMRALLKELEKTRNSGPKTGDRR